MLEELAKELFYKITDKYGTVYKASKETAIDASSIHNLLKRPAWSNVHRLASACGFQMEVRFI